MTILTFPLPKDQALSLIRDAAAAGRVRLPRFPGDAWEQRVTSRQVLLCLEKGEIEKIEDQDKVGNYLYWLFRFSAGVGVRVKVVLTQQDNVWWVRVVEIRHE